jgi:hypothetical protein
LRGQPSAEAIITTIEDDFTMPTLTTTTISTRTTMTTTSISKEQPDLFTNVDILIFEEYTFLVDFLLKFLYFL